MENKNFILGAGITGLSAGIASGWKIYEAAERPGGICTSYYINGSSNDIFYSSKEETYRFEIGGGHWIFGGDHAVLNFINKFVKLKTYQRRSAVYFSDPKSYVPYPIQNHLRCIDEKTAIKALIEIMTPKQKCTTLKEWLLSNFGETLCEYFFYPFHDLYTANLYEKIAPQDEYKSPISPSSAVKGIMSKAPSVGYNATFVYPSEGLDKLVRGMANKLNIEYGKKIVNIDTKDKIIYFSDGTDQAYQQIISTLPLNETLAMSGLTVPTRTDPHTSVLVLNIGAMRGDRCPDFHWLYIPKSRSGFHRVGFYSNVDNSFLPKGKKNRVSIYVERAYLNGDKPDKKTIKAYCDAVVNELQDWGYIEEVEVLDPTWIDVAYTWSWPKSKWKERALRVLESHNIYQNGRYGHWTFQGIAKSIKDGLVVGNCFKRL